MPKKISSTNVEELLRLVGINEIDIDRNSKFWKIFYNCKNIVCIDFEEATDTLTSPVFSTYYTTINYYEAMAWQNISHNLNVNPNESSSLMHMTPTFEDIIGTDDNISVYDLNNKWSWTLINETYNKEHNIKPVEQMKSYYMEQPLKFGFYCIYTNPKNSTMIVPDCPNATDIIIEHIKMLSSSGIDFFIPDDTNLVGGSSNIESYVLQIRPNELIFQTLYKLHQNGTNVPKIAFWNPANGIEWKINLEFYNNPNYSNLIYSAPNQRKNNNINPPIEKVYFVNQNRGINQSVFDLIESNGGRNDIFIIKMWCHESLDETNNGTWSWMQGCFTENLTYNQETTSTESIKECNYQMTKNSSLGTQISATFS